MPGMIMSGGTVPKPTLNHDCCEWCVCFIYLFCIYLRSTEIKLADRTVSASLNEVCIKSDGIEP